jgi:hypothetical protein
MDLVFFGIWLVSFWGGAWIGYRLGVERPWEDRPEEWK